MDGILVQNNNAEAMRPTLAGRSKGVGGPRKALANIQNTHHSKSVTFDRGSLKPNKITQLNKGAKSNTPGPKKGIKIYCDKPSMSKQKGIPTPFKIFKDTKKSESVSNQMQPSTRKKIPIHEHDIEYMPPCTDKEFEIHMPSYLHKACKQKPIFNIDIPTRGLSEKELEMFTEKINTETLRDNERILCEGQFKEAEIDIEDFLLNSFSNSKNMMTDEDLFGLLESDDSFSLEALDREIRSAGLDPPSW